MLRITFEILPGGSEAKKRVIGLMELALIKIYPAETADYAVVMKKCPAFNGALRTAWRRGRLTSDGVLLLPRAFNARERSSAL